MVAFREAYDAWMGVPFPSGDAEDSIGDLHDDVALVDTWVAESVVPYVKHGAFIPATPDVLGELQALSERATALGAAGGAPEYLRYIVLLSDLYSGFLRERPA
jgi:hypothetical protein